MEKVIKKSANQGSAKQSKKQSKKDFKPVNQCHYNFGLYALNDYNALRAVFSPEKNQIVWEENPFHNKWLIVSTKGVAITNKEPLYGVDTFETISEDAEIVIPVGNDLTLEQKKIVCYVLRELHFRIPKNVFTRIAHAYGFNSKVVIIRDRNLSLRFKHQTQETSTKFVSYLGRTYKKVQCLDTFGIGYTTKNVFAYDKFRVFDFV